MIDPAMLFCVSGVALALALLVVFGSWVEDVARSEKHNISLELMISETRDDEPD